VRDLGNRLKAKLPSRQEALTVFSVILFVIFSWALYRTFWWVPSWLEYLSVWSILIIIAYVVAFALLESLVILALLTSLSLFLPRKIFKDQFILQGSTLSLLLGLGAFLIQRNVGVIYRLQLEQTLLYPLLILGAVILLTFLTSLLFKRIQLLARFTQAVAERMTIFAYLYVPMGLIGLVVVIIRNLW
jgi:hypothetical protein